MAGDSTGLTDEVYDALQNIKQLSDAGAKGTPRVASKLANPLNNVDEELYWDEARRFYSNISRLSANEYNSMNPQLQRAVGQLERVLNDVLNDTAAGVGKGDDYAQAMQFWGKAKSWQKFRRRCLAVHQASGADSDRRRSEAAEWRSRTCSITYRRTENRRERRQTDQARSR